MRLGVGRKRSKRECAETPKAIFYPDCWRDSMAVKGRRGEPQMCVSLTSVLDGKPCVTTGCKARLMVVSHQTLVPVQTLNPNSLRCVQILPFGTKVWLSLRRNGYLVMPHKNRRTENKYPITKSGCLLILETCRGFRNTVERAQIP
jgi:hypothetical protein